MIKNRDLLREQIITALKTIYDPEIPVDIYELGLIYDINIEDSNNIKIKMSLTSSGCPVAESMPVQIEERIKTISEINNVNVTVVWDPPWSQEMMSEAARLELGIL